MLRTGGQAGGGAARQEGEKSQRGPNTRDFLCVPQDLRQRGVAVIRPGEGRKLAGLGERGKHTQEWQRGRQQQRQQGGQRSEGGYSLGGGGRGRRAFRESREGGGDRLAWEPGPPEGPSASRVGVRGRREARFTRGEVVPGSLLVPSSLAASLHRRGAPVPPQ